MKISILVPCFNGADTIGVQLEAIARQVYSDPWEVIYIDNGSTDGSLDIVESYRSRLPALTVVQAWGGSGPRQPVTRSYRLGIAAATGDAFLMCEADDEIAPGYIAAMAKALATHELVASRMDYQRLNPDYLVWGEHGGNQTLTTGLVATAGPMYLPYALGCSLGMRRSLVDRIGGPSDDCSTSWDLDYCWTAHAAGVELHFASDAMMHYRVRQGFRARFQQARNWARGQSALNLKYGPPNLLRYSAYCVVRLATTSLALAAGTLSGKRPAEFYVWDVGFAWGKLQGIRDLIRHDAVKITATTGAQKQAESMMGASDGRLA